MFLLLLSILFCTLINADDDSNEEKYIDLLPEEEKQVFLERVARSLISEVKTNDSKYKSSEKLSNEELNQHGQFVRPVFEEESSNLRRDTDDDKDKPESREILKVRGVNDQNIVSELRQGSRSKRNKDGNNDYETIPVKTVYDVDDLKVKKAEPKYHIPLDVVTENMVSGEKSVEKSTNEVDIQVRGPKRQSRKANVDLNARRTITSNKATIINDFDPDEVTESDVDNNQDNAKEEENRSESSKTKTSNADFNQNGFTQAIYEPHEGSEYSKNSRESPEEVLETESVTVNSPNSVLTTPTSTSLTTEKTTYQTYKPLIDITTATTNIKNTSMNILVNSNDSKQHLRVKSDEGPEVDLSLSSKTSYLNKNDTKKYFIGVSDFSYNSTENNSNSEKTYNLNSDIRNRLSDDNNLKVEIIDSTNNKINKQFEENNHNVAENSSSENISSKNRKEKKYVERGDVTNPTDTDNFKMTSKRKNNLLKSTSFDHKYDNQSASVTVEEIGSDLDPKSKTFANELLKTESVINSTEGNNIQEPIKLEAKSLELDNINKEVKSHVKESDLNRYSDNVADNVLKDVVASKSNYEIKVKSNTSISQEGSNNLQNEEILQGVNEHVSRSSLRLSKDNDDENRNNAENSMTSINKQDLISDEKKEQDKVEEVIDSYKSNIKQNVHESESNETNNLKNINDFISTTSKINEYVHLDISNNSNLVNYFSVIKNQTKKNTLRSKNFNEFVLTTTENSYMEKPYFDVFKYQPYSSQHTASDERNDPYNSKEEIKLDKYHAQAVINSNENESESYKKNGQNYPKTNFTDVSYVSQSVNLEKIIHQLKEELGSLNKDDMKTHKENDLPTNKNIQKYSVYELPAGETPFITQKPKVDHNEEFLNQEEPYYVPVYNYSPNNAYYNAYNRLGPNDEENQEDENVRVENGKYADVRSKENLDSSSELYNIDLKSEHEALRKFKFSGKSPQSPFKSRTRTKSFDVPLPVVINKPNFTKTYFNPDEYLDMDYYSGRSNRNSKSRPRNKRKKHSKSPVPLFPKSEELDHPYNLLDSGNVKSHLSAVRQVLYKQHRFGFVPEITAPSEENSKPIENNPSVGSQEHSKHFRSKNLNEFIVLLPNELIGKTPESVRRLDSSHRFRKRSSVRMDGKQKGKEKWKRNAGRIRDILSISDSKDVFLHLDKLQRLNLSYVRRNNEYKDVDVYASVLKDMIEADSKALKQYDWLGSTIDIRAALDKLSKLTDQRKNEEAIHPADVQLLNYVVYIYKSAKNSLKKTDVITLRKTDKKSNHLLPKNRNKKKEYLKTKGLINRVWLYIRGRLKATYSEGNVDELEDFGNFLYDLDSNLFDLHNALKHIAMVTNYKKQRFYENLKDIYVRNPQKKCLLEALLHLFTARFIGLVEYSALNGVEDGYFNYIENNIAVVERSEEELVFILKLLNEIKDLNK